MAHLKKKKKKKTVSATAAELYQTNTRIIFLSYNTSSLNIRRCSKLIKERERERIKLETIERCFFSLCCALPFVT